MVRSLVLMLSGRARMLISFEEWLHRLRLTRQLSQDGLAAELRYSKESVRKYESRGNRPSLGFATSLTGYLGLGDTRAQEFMTFVRGARANERQHVADWIGDLVEPQQARRAPTNLPNLLTRMVGRDDEIEQQFTLLARPEVRLLTCTGSAGVGKTRLAEAVAERMRDVTRDGVYLVELAPVRHPRDIERAVADSLRLRDVTGRTTLETLTDYLRAKHVLLVLDNLEHLAVASHGVHLGIAQQLIASLLTSAPYLKVLATSRVRLHIAGERAYVVQPFRLLAHAREHDLTTLARNPAIELFVERVRDVQPGFTLEPGNAEAVLGICRLVEGIPLAIELAAARCFALDPNAMHALLLERARLATLVEGSLDRDERQRTLRGAIDWSFGLLDSAGQRLFRTVGVFTGGFSAAGTNAVRCGVHVATASDEPDTRALPRDRRRFGRARQTGTDDLRQAGRGRTGYCATCSSAVGRAWRGLPPHATTRANERADEWGRCRAGRAGREGPRGRSFGDDQYRRPQRGPAELSTSRRHF